MHRRICAVFSLLCACAFAGAPVSAGTGKRVALVIGNSAYKIAPLANPVNDARAVASALQDIKFDEVILRQDLTGDGMRATLREIGRAAVGADIVVVFFAGHGLELHGRNYLIPVDANPERASDVELEAINLDTVLQQLEGATRLKLVILDACRNNPFRPAGGKRSVERGLARVEPDDNTLVAYAAKEGTTADDGTGQRNSPFTAALLKHIATPDIDIRLMLGRIRDDVISATSDTQRPHIYGTLGGSAISLSMSEGGTHASLAPSQDVLNRLEASEAEKRRLERQLADEARRRGDAERLAAEAAKVETMRAEIEALKRQRETREQQAMLAPPAPASPSAERPRSAKERCHSQGDFTLCASSVRSPEYGNSYLPVNMLDGNDRTAWVEGVRGDGTGQWVVFDFQSRRKIRQVLIKNGYGKNSDIFHKNGRVQSGELVFSNGQRIPFRLDDHAEQQVIDVASSGDAAWMQLKVTSVYAGWKYQDLAINEIRLIGN